MDFVAGVYLSEDQNPIPPPSLRTVYLFTQGKGGELNQRKGKRSNSSQSWVVKTNMTDCFFVYKL